MYKSLSLIFTFLFLAGAYAQEKTDLDIKKASSLISASGSFELIALNTLSAYKETLKGSAEEDESGVVLLDASNLHGKVSLLAISAYKKELSDTVGNQLVRDILESIDLFKRMVSNFSESSKNLLREHEVNVNENVEKAEEQLKRYLALLE